MACAGAISPISLADLAFPLSSFAPSRPGFCYDDGTQPALIRRHVGKHVSYAASNRTLLVNGVENVLLPRRGKKKFQWQRDLAWLDGAGWGFEKLIDEQSPTMVGLLDPESRCGAGDSTGWKPNGSAVSARVSYPTSKELHWVGD